MLVGGTQRFVNVNFLTLEFFSLFDLAHEVSSYCKELQSHLCNYKPSQLPPWCYVICVLHGNHLFPWLLWPFRKSWAWLLQDLQHWGSQEAQQCLYIPAYCTAPAEPTFIQFVLLLCQSHLWHWNSLFYSLFL